MTTWALLALAAVAPQDDREARDVRALIEQLGSEDLGQRESAREQILRKGRPVRKHLQAFLASKSPELVAQVRSILDRFDWDEQLERTLPPERVVTIPAGRRTPEEILRLVTEQTGCRVAVYAVNLRAPVDAGWDRAPVLRVLDDLCRKLGRGAVTASPLEVTDEDEMRSRGRRAQAPDRLVLDGEQPLPPAVAHWKQFRAAVTDVSILEQRSLSEGVAPAHAQVTVSVTAQPGLQPVYVGAWTIEEVTDDRGGSLRIGDGRMGGWSGTTPPEPGDDAETAWFGSERWSSGEGTVGLPMKPPTAGASRLRLRAKVRVAFAAKEVARTLTVADFKESEELVFGGVKVTVTKAANAERKFSLQYSIEGRAQGRPQFDLLDAQGAMIRPRGSLSSGADTKRSTEWTLPAGASVATVRLTARVGHRAFDVPFEWNEIPVPAEDK